MTKKAYIHLLAGQSNAVGIDDASNLSSGNAGYNSSYSGILTKVRHVDWQTAAINYDQQLGELVPRTDGKFGAESVICRSLAARIPRDRQYDDKAVLLKYASGGVPLNAWRPSTDTTNFWPDFSAWLSSSVTELRNSGYTIAIGNFYWMQGESDSNAAASPNYVTRFQDFLTNLQTVQPGFNSIVFSELKANRGTQEDPYAATINSAMSAVYPTSGSNDDTSTIDGIHYDADSMVDISQRLSIAV